MVQSYLAALAPLLARAVRGRDILSELREVERLFGNTWLMDSEPFEPALSKWREFREAYEQFAIRGMTVNERLCALGFSEAYDNAVSSKDTASLRRILSSVYVDDESIEKIIADVKSRA